MQPRFCRRHLQALSHTNTWQALSHTNTWQQAITVDHRPGVTGFALEQKPNQIAWQLLLNYVPKAVAEILAKASSTCTVGDSPLSKTATTNGLGNF